MRPADVVIFSEKLCGNDQNRTQVLRRPLGFAGVQSRGFRSWLGLASSKLDLASIV